MEYKEGTAPDPPYCVYYSVGATMLYGDNTNYGTFTNVNLELYTDKKDLASESKVEKILNDNEFAYTKTETYWSDEKLYEVLYEFTL